MSRSLCLIVFLCCCPFIYGQQADIGDRIEGLDIPHKKEIIAHWRSYVEAARQGEAAAHLWSDGSEDFLLDFLPGFYNEFNQSLSDLQLNQKGQYRLIIHADHLTEKRVGAVQGVDYQLYVVSAPEGWRLMNSFDVAKSNYMHYATEHVDFYTQARPVAEEQMKLIEQYIEHFEKRYGVSMNSRLTFVYFAGSASRAMSDLGIIKVYDGLNAFAKARYLVNSHTIVSPVLPEFHELVHAIMVPNYPDALLLLHEGIAVFEGESSGLKEKRKDAAVRYLSLYKMDFTTQNQLNALLEHDAMAYYAIASAIIEYCFNTQGAEAVKHLFEAVDYDDVFNRIGVEPSDRTSFVYSLFGI